MGKKNQLLRQPNKQVQSRANKNQVFGVTANDQDVPVLTRTREILEMQSLEWPWVIKELDKVKGEDLK